MKQCNRCHQTKPIDQFYREKKMPDGHRKQCKECRNKEVMDRRNKDPEAYNAYMRERRLDPKIAAQEKEYDITRYLDPNSKRREHAKANRKRQRAEGYDLMYYYGITQARRQEMVDDQNGCCAICGKPESDFKRGLMVDHNHITKEVRGMLCDTHNKMLGNAKDSIEILENAIAYLRRSKLKVVS